MKKSIKKQWEDLPPVPAGYYIYKLTNPATKEFYIGLHNGAHKDNYSGSGIWARQMKKSGIKLTKTVIFTTNNITE